MKLPANPLTILCPVHHCNAQPGHPCFTAGGEPYPRCHDMRRVVATEVKMATPVRKGAARLAGNPTGDTLR